MIVITGRLQQAVHAGGDAPCGAFFIIFFLSVIITVIDHMW